MRRDMFREIQHRDSMQFVYAAFYDDRDDVFVKVGRSGTPYKRMMHISQGVPFVLARGVFACVGSIKAAESIECGLKAHLESFRTRGEWYRFSRADGKTFSTTIRNIFAKVTGRQLKWTVVDAAAMRAEMEAGFYKRIGVESSNKAA